MLVRYEGGARGVLFASQISTGDENNLNIRVYGTDASIEWHQEHPNELIVKFADAPRQVWRRGNSYNGPEASKTTRLPFGHPEAFIEAFANIYLAAAEAIARFGNEETVRNSLVNSLLKQQEPSLQIAVIDLLTSLKERRVMPVLQILATNEDTSEYVKKKAEESIKRLSI